MAFGIDDPETEELVRLLAEKLGVSLEEAITVAVRNELQMDDETSKPIKPNLAGP